MTLNAQAPMAIQAPPPLQPELSVTEDQVGAVIYCDASYPLLLVICLLLLRRLM